MKLYMFRAVRLSIIRILFTVHSAMIYVIQVCRQLSSRTRIELQFHPGPARKLSHCCRLLLDQLLVSRQGMKFAALFATEGPLPYSQRPATFAYPVPDQPSRRPRIFCIFSPYYLTLTVAGPRFMCRDI
jgi:hypothetical protein